MIYSHSRLSKYDDCPAAFYKKYVLEIPEIVSEAAVIGKAVHQSIELYLHGKKLDDAINLAVASAELPINYEEVHRLCSHDAVATMLTLKDKLVEHHFEEPLDGLGSPVLQGYIDLWWQDSYGVNLFDWKTNRHKFSPEQSHQLGLYAWYLSQVTGYKKVQGSLVFLRMAYDDCCTTMEFGPAEIEKSRSWAIHLAGEIETRLAELSLFNGSPDLLFPATPNSHCRWCSYASDCIGSACYTSTDLITSPDEAQSLAKEIIRLEAALDDMKGQLKNWVKGNGPVIVGDQEFSFNPSVSWSFQPDKLKEFCTALSKMGINPWELLSIGSSQLKKTGLPEDTLIEFAKKKETLSFRRIKSKNDVA